jgi:hypothetical protein
MGTRADFYVGMGPTMVWLASTAWDGYPEGITPGRQKDWPKGASIFEATTEADWRARLDIYLTGREDVSRPATGWPWPWEDSRTTDYAYTFHEGKVHGFCYGHPFDIATREDQKEDHDPPKYDGFPDMSDSQRIAFGKRSGVIVVG